MRGPLDVHRELLGRGVPHEIVQLPRRLSCVDDLPQALGLDPSDCIAVRLYEGDRRWIAALLPVHATPDDGRLSSALGLRRGRLARAPLPHRVSAATDFSANLVPPLPLPPEMDVVADPSVCRTGVAYTATGDARTALAIPRDALLTVTGARLVPLVGSEGEVPAPAGR